MNHTVKNNQPVYVMPDKTRNRILIGVGVVAGVLVIWQMIDKVIQDAKKRDAERRAATEPNVGHAMALRTSMNPSGNRWMFYFDGTNEEQILRTGEQISDLPGVEKEYENLFDKDSLLTDLQGEMKPESYQKFLAFASKGKTGNPYFSAKKLQVPAAMYVVTTKEAHVRKEPKYTRKFDISSNIIKTVEPNTIIGLTTGRAVYAELMDILFVEVNALDTKQNTKVVFVAKSQVEFLTPQEKINRERIYARKYAYFYIGELKGLGKFVSDYDFKLVTIRPCEIADSFGLIKAKAGKGITLGFLLKRLETPTGMWLKFNTVQGLVRWVKETDVLVIKNTF